MPALYSLADLKAAYQRKEKLKYLYFWGHTPKLDILPLLKQGDSYGG